jgi:hypothetical protein
MLALPVTAAEPAVQPSIPKVKPAGICSVHREQYVRSPRPGVSTSVDTVYVGNGLRRREIHVNQALDDIQEGVRERFSEDNGRAWSPMTPRKTTSDDLQQNGCRMAEAPYSTIYDPVSRKTIETFNRTIFLADPGKSLQATVRGDIKSYDHALYRLSDDEGHAWLEPRLFTYEKGAPFNPDNWADPAFLTHNRMDCSYDMIKLADSRLGFPVYVPVPYKEDEEDRKVCTRVPWFDTGKGYVLGAMCFFGTWNRQKNDYEWTQSKPVFVPRRVSTRGLTEPALAQLTDGRLLLEMRGSNARLDPVKSPSRKWISLSKDGGKTWSPVTDLRYDTGEQFYAPSSFARIIRSSKTGKLYWIGNISREPARANGPRYPLYIAELDETKVALKKSTLTVIDDRGPTDTVEVQMSNFSLLENRETKDLELYLTRYQERSVKSPFDADAYKYTLKLFN